MGAWLTHRSALPPMHGRRSRHTRVPTASHSELRASECPAESSANQWFVDSAQVSLHCASATSIISSMPTASPLVLS